MVDVPALSSSIFARKQAAMVLSSLAPQQTSTALLAPARSTLLAAVLIHSGIKWKSA